MNNTNTVKVVVNRSDLHSISPGRILNIVPSTSNNIQDEDKVLLKTIIVQGNKQYKNGKRLDVWVKPNMSNLY